MMKTPNCVCSCKQYLYCLVASPWACSFFLVYTIVMCVFGGGWHAVVVVAQLHCVSACNRVLANVIHILHIYVCAEEKRNVNSYFHCLSAGLIL